MLEGKSKVIAVLLQFKFAYFVHCRILLFFTKREMS